MTSSKILIWKFGIASLALFLAIAVYCFARIYPPELLASFQATHTILAAQTGLFGSAPSFFYTLAIGMLVGTSAPALSDARRHCLVWIAVACFLELSQHSFVAEPLASWLAVVLSGSIWEFFVPYWGRGVFDPLDLLASVAGGFTALTLLTKLSMENNDENHR